MYSTLEPFPARRGLTTFLEAPDETTQFQKSKYQCDPCQLQEHPSRRNRCSSHLDIISDVRALARACRYNLKT
jgi:hypothetical protein